MRLYGRTSPLVLLCLLVRREGLQLSDLHQRRGDPLVAVTAVPQVLRELVKFSV
jgi:hypothetical protein